MAQDKSVSSLNDLMSLYDYMNPRDLSTSVRRLGGSPTKEGQFADALMACLLDPKGFFLSYEDIQAKVAEHINASGPGGKERLKSAMRIFHGLSSVTDKGNVYGKENPDPYWSDYRGSSTKTDVTQAFSVKDIMIQDQGVNNGLADGRRRLAVFTTTSDLVNPGVRGTNEIDMFLNHMPPLVASRMVPLLQVEMQLMGINNETLSTPSVLRFLLGGVGTKSDPNLAGNNSNLAMFSGFVQSANNSPDNKVHSYQVSGMENFLSPQTMTNMDGLRARWTQGSSTSAAEPYARVVDAKPFTPYASIEDFQVTIVNAGAGAFAHKKASLKLKIHDKARLGDFSPFIRGPVGYRTAVIWTTYGWIMPKTSDPVQDAYANFVNSNMITRDAWQVANTQFSFDATGQTVLTLEMVYKAVSTIQKTSISAMTNQLANQYASITRIMEELTEIAVLTGGLANLGPEMRASQLLNAASTGVLPELQNPGEVIESLITIVKATGKFSNDRLEKLKNNLSAAYGSSNLSYANPLNVAAGSAVESLLRKVTSTTAPPTLPDPPPKGNKDTRTAVYSYAPDPFLARRMGPVPKTATPTPQKAKGKGKKSEEKPDPPAPPADPLADQYFSNDLIDVLKDFRDSFSAALDKRKGIRAKENSAAAAAKSLDEQKKEEEAAAKAAAVNASDKSGNFRAYVENAPEISQDKKQAAAAAGAEIYSINAELEAKRAVKTTKDPKSIEKLKKDLAAARDKLKALVPADVVQREFGGGAGRTKIEGVENPDQKETKKAARQSAAAPVPGDKSQDIELNFEPSEDIVSFGKLFTCLAAPAILSTETCDELQIIFYKLNDQCGPVSGASVAEFPIDLTMLAYAYKDLLKSGHMTGTITIEEFLKIIINSQFADNRAIGYGMSSFYEPFDGKNKEAKQKEKVYDTLMTKWLSRYGSLQRPVIEMYIESGIRGTAEMINSASVYDNLTMSQYDIDVSTAAKEAALLKTGSKSYVIKRVHIYDKQHNPFKLLSEVISVGDNVWSLGSVNTGKIRDAIDSAYSKHATEINAQSGDINAAGLADKLAKEARGNNADADLQFIDRPGGADIRFGPYTDRKTVRDRIAQTAPNIRLGNNGTMVLTANLASKTDGLMGAINIMNANKTSGGTGLTPGVGGLMEPNGLPLRVVPAQLTLSTMGVPTARIYQQFFIDLGTGTTLDSLYRSTQIQHTISQGKFVTNWTFAFGNGYGKFSNPMSVIQALTGEAQRRIKDTQDKQRSDKEAAAAKANAAAMAAAIKKLKDDKAKAKAAPKKD